MKNKIIYAALCSILFCTACNHDSKKELPKVEKPSGSVVPVKPADTQTVENEIQETVITFIASGNTLEDIKFDKTEIEIERPDKIIIELINKSTDPDMMHNIVITEEGKYKEAAIAAKNAGAAKNYAPDKPYIIVASPIAKPGQKISMEFASPPPGNYNFVCTYPDHDAKMHGIITIKE